MWLPHGLENGPPEVFQVVSGPQTETFLAGRTAALPECSGKRPHQHHKSAKGGLLPEQTSSSENGFILKKKRLQVAQEAMGPSK